MSSLLKKVQYAAKTAKDVTSGILDGEEVKCSPEKTKERNEICAKCPKLQELLGRRQCGECGCFLDLKVTLEKAKCPISKW